MKNYYEIMQVDRKATIEIIKAVYKVHIKKKHPDLFQGEEKLKAEEELKELNEAYEILSDEKKRLEYDQQIEENELLEKNLIDDIMKENILLKKIIDNNENLYMMQEMDNEYFQQTPFEYEADTNVTEKNNKQHLRKLIWQERILRLIIVVICAVAIVGGIYKATGINILSTFLKAFFKNN